MTTRVTVYSNSGVDEYYEETQKQFRNFMRNLPTFITEADKCFARENHHKWEGHTSTRGEELLGNFPDGFIIGKGVV